MAGGEGLYDVKVGDRLEIALRTDPAVEVLQAETVRVRTMRRPCTGGVAVMENAALGAGGRRYTGDFFPQVC